MFLLVNEWTTPLLIAGAVALFVLAGLHMGPVA